MNLKFEWTKCHYQNKKITDFVENTFDDIEQRKAAYCVLNFIKEEYPDVARPLFGDLLWTETKEGTWPQQ